MLGRKLGRKVGMAVMASGLLAGMLGVVGVTAAHAVGTSAAFFVAPPGDGGNDGTATPAVVGGNNCTLASKPCATIEHAIVEEASISDGATGSVINLTKGTFNSSTDTMFAGITAANANVTITGAGIKGKRTTTTVAPQSCSSLATTGDAANLASLAIVGLKAGDNGISIENMVLEGAGVVGCTGYGAAIDFTGGVSGVAAVGDLIQSGTTYGILTDNNADSTIISNQLTPVVCSTTAKGPNTGLNAGWTTPANLQIKSLPKCEKFVESGHAAATGVFINGVAYCMTLSASKKTIVITGTPDPSTGCTTGGDAIVNSAGQQIATGDTVIFNTSVAPFTQWGIACNSPIGPTDATTDCAISDNTVTGGGTVYHDFPVTGDFPPVGIVITGSATADVDGNTVSDVADTIQNDPVAGATTNDGIGIGLIPNATGASAGATNVGVNLVNSPNTAHGNTVAGDDVGIAVIGGPAGSFGAIYQVNGNTVGGNQAGVFLENLGTGAGQAGLATPMESNTISGVATGAGLEAEGIQNQVIGGPLASEGNTITGNGVGFALAPCTSATLTCESVLAPVKSTGNLIQNNTMSGNIAYGELSIGSYQVDELAQQVPTLLASTLSSTGNTFNANNWGTATSATNGTLPTEINGAEVEDGTGWGGGCTSELGDCVLTAGLLSLTYEGANQQLSATNPGSGTLALEVCNSGASSVDLPRGSEITFNTPNNVTNLGPQEANDGGTFFVTADAIVTGDASCANTNLFNTITVQAIAPAKVGTLAAPSGNPYNIGAGDTVYVNANGAANAAGNTYGTGANANTCAPAGSNGNPNVFGTTDPPVLTLSTTLQASTGGVNATYTAC